MWHEKRTFETDKKWADKFNKQVKSIVGPLLLEESDFRTDTEKVGDFTLVSRAGTTIACRIRKHSYLSRFKNEFTIRSHRDSGARTEMAKIVDEGFGTWFFYGFCDEKEENILCARILDFHRFRGRLIRVRNKDLWTAKDNGDGTRFLSFKIEDFPNIVVHEYDPLNILKAG